MDKKRNKIDTGLNPSKKDSRPIKDKDYQTQCLKKIIKFIILNNYPLSISLQQCQSGDISIFRDIIDFLLKILDPHLIYSSEKELQDILKFIGYPYPLHSSIFSGASNYWPHLVALMAWVVDLIKLYRRFEEKDIFSEYFLESYGLFMQDKSRANRDIEFDQEIIEYLEKNYKESEEVKKENKRLREERKELKKNVIKEIDENIKVKMQELEVEIIEMGKVEEEETQLEANLQFYKGVLEGCFGERVPDRDEFVSMIQEGEFINEENKILECEINEILEKIQYLSEVSSEDLLGEYAKETEIQEEIDNLRRNNGYLMEEIELTEDDIGKAEKEIENADREFTNKEGLIKESLEEDYKVIMDHSNDLRSWLSELPIVNK